jgi:hypothetical protein
MTREPASALAAKILARAEIRRQQWLPLPNLLAAARVLADAYGGPAEAIPHVAANLGDGKLGKAVTRVLRMLARNERRRAG